MANVTDAWLDQPNLRVRDLLRGLLAGGVDFVIIGGIAVIMQGAPRLTKDLDICYSTDVENLDRLGNVLIALKAQLRGVEDEVPFIPDGRTLRHTQILTLSTADGNLDLLVRPDGSPAFNSLKTRADEMDINGLKVRVASVTDLIAMKRASGRAQDLVDLETLEIIRHRSRASSRRS